MILTSQPQNQETQGAHQYKAIAAARLRALSKSQALYANYINTMHWHDFLDVYCLQL